MESYLKKSKIIIVLSGILQKQDYDSIQCGLIYNGTIYLNKKEETRIRFKKPKYEKITKPFNRYNINLFDDKYLASGFKKIRERDITGILQRKQKRLFTDNHIQLTIF